MKISGSAANLNEVTDYTCCLKEQNAFLQNPVDGLTSNLKILIAEDDEFSELLIRELLRNFAREIVSVDSGGKAVDFCRSNPDTDLVLMDVRMPEMSGYEATRQIRLFNSDLVVVAQTALTLNGEWEKAADAGCNDYITKPLTTRLLVRLLIKHFGARIIRQLDQRMKK